MSPILAFDRASSMRSYDEFGRLRVERTNISKAVVNGYMGSEVPGWAELGLDPERVYMLLRDPAELEKAARTFNGIPVLDDHVASTADDHPRGRVVGCTGNDSEFSAPYLTSSLWLWDNSAIAGIETEERCELSCSYKYVPVMEPGEYEGVAYDGRMVDIVGNHVALVARGRAGPDVLVADEDKFGMAKKRTKRADKLHKLLQLFIGPRLAADAEIGVHEIAEIVEMMEGEEKEQEEPEMIANDSPADKIRAMLRGKVDEEVISAILELASAAAGPAPAVDENEPDTVTREDAEKMASDAARSEVQRLEDRHRAEREVRPLVGDVLGMDSAEAVYKFALDSAGIEVSDAPASAYRAMVKMAIDTKTVKSPPRPAPASADKFPALARFK